jgi:hypothetical protein
VELARAAVLAVALGVRSHRGNGKIRSFCQGQVEERFELSSGQVEV